MADENELEGAVLPDGIEVDETSAYFGITDSSDLINRLAETDRLNGLGEFLSITGELLLKQATFDFQTERLVLRLKVVKFTGCFPNLLVCFRGPIQSESIWGKRIQWAIQVVQTPVWRRPRLRRAPF